MQTGASAHLLQALLLFSFLHHHHRLRFSFQFDFILFREKPELRYLPDSVESLRFVNAISASRACMQASLERRLVHHDAALIQLTSHTQNDASTEVILRKGRSALFAHKNFELEVYHHRQFERSDKDASGAVTSKDYPFDAPLAELSRQATQQLRSDHRIPTL